MTSWGNRKQRACLWLAAGLFIISILCGIEATNTGAPTLLRAVAVFSSMLGMVALAGVWSMGLTKDADPQQLDE